MRYPLPWLREELKADSPKAWMGNLKPELLDEAVKMGGTEFRIQLLIFFISPLLERW